LQDQCLTHFVGFIAHKRCKSLQIAKNNGYRCKLRSKARAHPANTHVKQQFKYGLGFAT
jgi:hypothetical protein